MTWLVIFGAGASYDALPESAVPQAVKGTRPSRMGLPLARDLFGPRPSFIRIRKELSDLDAITREIQAAVGRGKGDGIEREMQRWVEHAAGGYESASRALIAARFYLRDAITTSQEDWVGEVGQASNYNSLLHKIELRRRKAKEHVVLATFNYDTMLEAACNDTLGFRPTMMSEYVDSNPDYSLLKPHGSIDWIRAVKDRPVHLSPKQLISLGSELPTDGELMMAAQGQGTASIPAVAVPVSTKDLFECPDKHLKDVESLLRETTAIFVVGWRAQEYAFLEWFRGLLPNPTSGTVKTALIVTNCREEGEVTSQSLKASLPVLWDTVISGACSERCDEDISRDTGFSRFIAHTAEDELLVLGSP